MGRSERRARSDVRVLYSVHMTTLPGDFEAYAGTRAVSRPHDETAPGRLPTAEQRHTRYQGLMDHPAKRSHALAVPSVVS